MYDNFLLLHVAISILCNKQKYKSDAMLAEAILKRFIENYAEIYGDHHVVYTVHCLSHLVADSQRFGSLDEFSAFPFESFMFQIKMLLRKNNQPLAQLCNRLHEMHISNHHQRILNEHTKLGTVLKKPILDKEKSGRLLYKEIVIDGDRYNCSFKEKWFYSENDEIVSISKIEKINGNIYLVGNTVDKKRDLYAIPIKSSYLDIYTTDGRISKTETRYGLSSIKKKLFAMRNGEDLIFFPLLHSNAR